jgi:hypothetical protein
LHASSSAINHALIRTNTVTIDLMQSHHDHPTSGNLWHVSSVRGEHLGDLGRWIVGPSTKSLTAGIGRGVLEAGGVLLEWIAV